MPETVLVTGGTGFVAGWTIVELLRRGYTVRTTIRSATKELSVRAAVGTQIAGANDRLSFAIADLTRDDGWDAAVAGCDHVLHIASPLTAGAGTDPDALILPAREGTLRVLRAATRAGVRRVVMTSSTAASTPPDARRDVVADESVWSDPEERNTNAYRQSKLVAERAAWDFMAGATGPTTLTTILPGAIFGPVLSLDNLGSVQLVQRLLTGRMPAIPRVGFCVVDVRDLADLHIRAMTAPEAAGQRFIAVGDFTWLRQIAELLRSRLPEQSRQVPTRTLPDLVVRLAARVAPDLQNILPLLGRKRVFTSAKAQRVLGFSARPTADTIIDCAGSLALSS
jgi:nucleoside-diphosphate-sugar epimerase